MGEQSIQRAVTDQVKLRQDLFLDGDGFFFHMSQARQRFFVKQDGGADVCAAAQVIMHIKGKGIQQLQQGVQSQLKASTAHRARRLSVSGEWRHFSHAWLSAASGSRVEEKAQYRGSHSG